MNSSLLQSVRQSFSFWLMLGLLLLVRTSFADHYRVPTGSMEPTIQVGDHIFVNKAAYGLKIPLTQLSLLEWQTPQRGEVIVFDYPKDPSQTYVKRVIGLPGDHVQIHQGMAWVNDRRLPETESPAPSFSSDLDGEWIVPANQYFVMGDHRDNSADSRVWGFVPKDHIRGQALAKLWNFHIQNNLPSFSLSDFAVRL